MHPNQESASDSNERSLPISSSFHRIALSANGLSNAAFKEWVFDPRMLFNATEKWWGNKGRRPTPHEGLDFYAYITEKSDIQHIQPGFRYAAIFPGKVISVSKDFLGQSLFLRHDDHRKGKLILFTAYGHGIPLARIQPGAEVQGDEIIAAVANPPAVLGVAPPHLHISAGWIPDALSHDITWDAVAHSRDIVLINPLDILNVPFSVESLDDKPVDSVEG